MSYLPNNEQKMNDIIFANRNKEYGAYELRSSYGETVFRSLAIVMASFGTLAAIGFYLTHREAIVEAYTPPIIRDSIYVIPFNTPEEKVVEQKKTTSSATPPSSSSENQTNKPVIVDSDSTTVTSTLTANNESTLALNPLATIPGRGIGTETLVIEDKTGSSKLTEVKHGHQVDKMPEFEGGLKALNEFIRRNIRYPESALEENLGGKLYLKFIVDEKGYVTDVVLENSIRADLNNEALRVVRLIPRFKSPGMVDGEAVKTYYQIPIKFSPR